MRITASIDAKELAKVKELTGESKHSSAVRAALAGYIVEMERKKFLIKVLEGRVDYGRSNDELEAMGEYDAR